MAEQTVKVSEGDSRMGLLYKEEARHGNLGKVGIGIGNLEGKARQGG